MEEDKTSSHSKFFGLLQPLQIHSLRVLHVLSASVLNEWLDFLQFNNILKITTYHFHNLYRNMIEKYLKLT